MIGADRTVSCLMVTKNRAALARRAIQCFAEQSWPHRELVIIDDGEEDYSPVIAPYQDRCTIHYHRIEADSSRRLGALRNISLDRANGAFCAQWDDDDWYHPDRLTIQMREIEERNLDAVLLHWTLMHLNVPEYVHHPYRNLFQSGVSGTVLHRKSDLRYDNLAKSEDTKFKADLRETMRLGFVSGPHGHLYIRCFHGANTWDLGHFFERLWKWPQTFRYAWSKYVRRNIFTHPVFRLSEQERDAFDIYLRDSRELGILSDVKD